MNEKTLAKEELIGLQVTIKKCNDPNWINKSGLILDETKHTFLIEINDQQKRIAKKTAIFEFDWNRKRIELNGSKLTYKPEDRTKKIR